MKKLGIALLFILITPPFIIGIAAIAMGWFLSVAAILRFTGVVS